MKPTDLIAPAETAMLTFRHGTRFELHPDGSGTSGNWVTRDGMADIPKNTALQPGTASVP